MKIGRLAGYVGAGLLATSCTMTKPAPEKALEHAAKYLKGTEVSVAQRRVLSLPSNESYNRSHDIFYWDSLLSVNREKEYFQLGKQHITDSVNGIHKRKPIFQMPIEPKLDQKSSSILDSIKNEVAKYCTGEEFLKLEKNAPHREIGAKWGTSDNITTHYLGELAIKGAERKGFYDGMAAERKNIAGK